MTGKITTVESNRRHWMPLTGESTSELSAELGSYELLISGNGTVACFPLPSEHELLIGRSDQADLRLASNSVSRRHARIRLIGCELSLEDLGSANGTFARGQRLASNQRFAITPGESFFVGDFALVLRARRTTCEPPLSASDPGDAGKVVLNSSAMHDLYERAQAVARSEMNVLVLGETGVGKDVFAHSIHERSNRQGQPFLRLNCAAFSESLLESELFGHEKGAFTGAVCKKPGLLSTANRGSVFLDEVGELPLTLQAKLLQVIEKQEALSIGALKPHPIDVRFIAATNRDLDRAISSGTFRSDLYFRLAAFTFVLPPLRTRQDDILPLVQEFIRRSSQRRASATIPTIREDAVECLLRYPWPGNVRELRNVIERALVLSNGSELRAEHLLLPEARTTPPPVSSRRPSAPTSGPTLASFTCKELEERQRIIDTLNACAGNQSRAAAKLGISRSTLVNRLDTYRIERPRKRPS